MTFIDEHTADIQKLCTKHKVKRLFVFGSVLTDNFTAISDVDFIVDFEPLHLSDYADNYFDFKFALEEALLLLSRVSRRGLGVYLSLYF